MQELTLEILRKAMAGTAAAFRCVTTYQPAGGVGDRVFPPTYEGGKYAVEKRVLADSRIVDCVVLDSVQSQANRMELALLDGRRAGLFELPLVTAAFNDDRLQKKFNITSLEAPHRVADAIFRDSLYEGVIFRKSEKGKVLDHADISNATALFGLCPTALLFGIWDSTGPRGGLGAKVQRAIVSEIIGYGALEGVKTSSRIDPAQITLKAATVYERAQKTSSSPDWTVDESLAIPKNNQPKKVGKDGKPSEINHGNVTPTIETGGFTLSYAKQTTVLSLAALRRLRFPLAGESKSSSERDVIARTLLASLGLMGAVLLREQGADLRSRCLLVPTEEFVWELLANSPGKDEPKKYSLTGGQAVEVYKAALAEAKSSELPWEDEIELVPSEDLIKLVARSQELAMHQAEGDE